MNGQMQASSSRILYDVPCAVCRDHSSGKHYGVFACDGCAGFFKRSVRRDRRYTCKARTPAMCLIDKAHRNQCRACRLAKCLEVGMNKDAVQHERGPRNSTIRRQMALFLKDPVPPANIGINAPAIQAPPEQIARPAPALMAPMPVFPYHYNAFALMNNSIMNIPLRPPPSPPPILDASFNSTDPESICEAAARILFMNIKWTRSIAAFNALIVQDRIILLEESWKDLFVIGCAQFLPSFDLRVLVQEKRLLSIRDLETFETALAEIAKTRLDTNEFACLRAIGLFNVKGNSKQLRRLHDVRSIEILQKQTRFALEEYSGLVYAHTNRARASQIIRLSAVIDAVPSHLIVELFFRATIGEIPIERIIADMYRTERQSD